MCHHYRVDTQLIDGKDLRASNKCPPKMDRIMLEVYDLIAGEYLDQCDDIENHEPDLRQLVNPDHHRPHLMVSWLQM